MKSVKSVHQGIETPGVEAQIPIHFHDSVGNHQRRYLEAPGSAATGIVEGPDLLLLAILRRTWRQVGRRDRVGGTGQWVPKEGEEV